MNPLSIADLQRSGIAVKDAERAGFFDVEDASTIYPEFKPVPAYVIPYFSPAGENMTFDRGPFCRVRYLHANSGQGSFVPQKAVRYGQPRASGTRAYFPPVIDWQPLIEDAEEPIVITEGEKKALAGAIAGFPVIALGGVFNFMAAGDGLLPELQAINWRNREVYICFDSDAALNPNILVAEARLVNELQYKRGARCFLVRIPQDGEEKVGLDDYLVAHGPSGLVQLLKSATWLSALDAKVVALNKSCAWIEAEGLVYDLEERTFIKKDNFINGSRFSTIKHVTIGAGQRSGPKEISVARAWLTHPHAQRFGEILFRPGEGATVLTDAGRPALNMWTGWDTSSHVGEDVEPFLELSEFLFSGLPPEHRSLPLKLMAYKAQNPAEKIPLALLLVGPQGCGKTLWGECIRDAFAPYSSDVTSQAFHSEFQNWLEKTLIVLINEAEHDDMRRGADVLKSLISDLQRPMNEKYRPARLVKTYSLYILTSNSRAVGAFAPDDRRMIVVDCPPKREPAFYERVATWKRNGGCKALLNYLLNLDLKGWKPPAAAPMTAEKYMAYMESLSPVQRLAEEMRTATDHAIKRWLDAAMAWAQNAEVSNNTQLAAHARAIADGIRHYQIRDWYTPEELTLMFPHLVETLQGSRFDRSMPAGRISRELREAGLTYLQSADDPRGFHWHGAVKQYLVVRNFEDWRSPLRQVDFERHMKMWPTYGDAVKAGLR